MELTKLLISDHPDRLRMLYELGISRVILPKFDRMMETEHNNIHHIYGWRAHHKNGMLCCRKRRGKQVFPQGKVYSALDDAAS